MTDSGFLGLLSPALGGLAFLALASSSCSSDRYARPAGPAPRYETAPLTPWENDATSEAGGAEDVLQNEIDRALEADGGPPPKEKAPENQ